MGRRRCFRQDDQSSNSSPTTQGEWGKYPNGHWGRAPSWGKASAKAWGQWLTWQFGWVGRTRRWSWREARVAVRVRGWEAGGLEGFEQNSDRIQLIFRQDPSGRRVEDGWKRDHAWKQESTWEVRVAWSGVEADRISLSTASIAKIEQWHWSYFILFHFIFHFIFFYPKYWCVNFIYAIIHTYK